MSGTVSTLPTGTMTPEQFELALGVHLQTLYQRALRLTRRADAADDLVQDTLERAYRKRALFRLGTDLRAWLLCIMRNVWINGHRRRVQQPSVVPLESLDEAALHRQSTQHASSDSAVERLVTDALSEASILDAVNALPRSYRDVVVLVDVEGAPYRAVAETLSIPLGSVCSRLSRGRERVKRTLLDRGHPVDGLACAS
jgi:RNA polymerase sigma-70 factor, ECF subfamily